MNELNRLQSACDNIIKIINEEAFDNSLSNVCLTIQGGKSGSAKSYGWHWAKRWVNPEGEAFTEINITAEHIENTMQLFITLFHELLHHYNKSNDIKDTSRQGRYHNKNFKNTCDLFGLITVKDEKIGWTTPHQELSKRNQEIFEMCELTDDILVVRVLPAPKEKKERKKKTTIECLDCGGKFTVDEELADEIQVCPFCQYDLSNKGLGD